MERDERIAAARGDGQVDLLITNGMLVDVLSGRVHPTTIAVKDGVIVGLDRGYKARQTVDAGGRYVTPGLIDAHVHLESSMVAVDQFARAVVPRGTTAVVTDLHEIANVMGVPGIRFMMEAAAQTNLDAFVMLPPCVPATPLETSGAVLEASDLAPLLDEPSVIGLGELMNFPGAINGDPGVLAKVQLMAGRPIDGHAPGVTGQQLAAYIAAGPDSDHECTTPAEAEEKLQKGMYVFFREGTGARNLLDLLPAMNAQNSHRCCMCTDDRHPDDLLARGYIDSMLAMAVEAGVSPLAAVQMATINTARRFGLTDRGAVRIGARADLALFDDLERFQAAMVFNGGRMVALEGEAITVEEKTPAVPPSTFDVKGFDRGRLRIAGPTGATTATARVIVVQPDQLVTVALEADVPVSGGEVRADPATDVLKMAVVERHSGTGNVGLGLVRGFALRQGALASSVAHDSHNIVVVGASDDDMAAAVQRLVELGGGQVAVAGGKVQVEVPLPIAGLMSPQPLEEVAAGVGKLNETARAMGCSLADPFMTMSFMALPVIPELKLTDRGLVDVNAFAFVPLLT